MAEDIQQSTYQYLDFDIQVSKGDGLQFDVSVHSKGGDAHESITFPFDVNELDRYLDKVQIALLRSAQVHRQISDDELKVREFGEKLFQALFVQDVRSCYDRSLALAQSRGKGLRIRLNINADELAGLPWEFLFDPDKDDYLCLSAHTPVVRYLDSGQIIPPMEVELPLQVLGMISNPADLNLLDTEREKANLEIALAPLIEEGLAKLTWLENGSWRALLDALNGGPWHIFHFVGHGAYDEIQKEGIVAFEGANGRAQYINAGQLARLLGEHSYLRVVILNACESAQSGKEDMFSSTAATLLKRGIPAVIAMQYSISDAAAIELSQTFYKCLAAGLPVDAAISRARLALSFAVKDTLEWGTPVLLMRTEDGMLFNVKPSKESTAQRQEAVAAGGTAAIPPPLPPAVQAQAQPLVEPVAVSKIDRAADSKVIADELAIKADVAPAAQTEPAPKTTSGLSIASLKGKSLTWLIGGALAIVAIMSLCVGLIAIGRQMLIVGPTRTALASASQGMPIIVINQSTTPSPTFEPTSTIAPTTAPAPIIEPTTAVPATITDTPTATETPTLEPTRTPIPMRANYDFKEDMILIGAGEFQMGCNPSNNDENDCPSIKNWHTVKLNDYYIDRTERTNADFADFLNEIDANRETIATWVGENGYIGDGGTRIRLVGENWQIVEFYAEHPVADVTWEAARVYCEWLGGRLPTEAEWEKAARGYNVGYLYPWGNESPVCTPTKYYLAQTKDTESCGSGTTTVGKFKPNDYGLYDMLGNVWEWVADWFGPISADWQENPNGPKTGDERILRGGSWSNLAQYTHIHVRLPYSPDETAKNFGFRCAHDP